MIDQYHPAWKAKTSQQEINRRLRLWEMAEALGHARRAGLWRLDRRWRRPPAQVSF